MSKVAVYTKVESTYQGETQIDYQFASKLIRMGKENDKLVQTNTKGEKKKYVIADIEMPLPDGKMVTRSARCFEGNYNHADIINGEQPAMKAGDSYLTTLRFREDGTPDLQLSHLTNANRATADDFKALFLASGRDVDSVTVEEVAATAGAPTEGES